MNAAAVILIMAGAGLALAGLIVKAALNVVRGLRAPERDEDQIHFT